MSLLLVFHWYEFDLIQGPNDVLEKLYEIWSPIFPKRSTKEGAEIESTFKVGGFYYREIIPDRVAVISINTLSWYPDNTLASNCAPSWKESSIPGDLQFKWLYKTMKKAIARGISIYIIGHVPPISVDNQPQYYPNCYSHFLRFIGTFSSNIIGQFYGHMNKDVISLLFESTNKITQSLSYELISINSQTISDLDLNLPRRRIVGLSQILPSIVPVYNPAFKVISFTSNEQSNITLMTDQSQYHLDLESANEAYDLSPNPSAQLSFISSCSSKYDFELQDYSPQSLTVWLKKVQAYGVRYKTNPIQRYFECLEVHTSNYFDQSRLKSKIVVGYMGAVTGVFLRELLGCFGMGEEGKKWMGIRVRVRGC